MLTKEQQERLHIPSKEEFNRGASGEIDLSDYADNNGGQIIDKVFSSLLFDKDMIRIAKLKNSKFF